MRRARTYTVPPCAKRTATAPTRLMNRLLALLPALLLVACFGTHGTDDGPSDDAPRLDMGTGEIDAGPRRGDLGPGRPDAGPRVPDGGGRIDCSPHRASLTCGASPHFAGSSFDLPISIGGEGECYCGETIYCGVSVRPGPTGEPVEIDLNTELCHGGALCDACFPYIEGSCPIPALPAGEYPVWLNGERAFDLEVQGDFVEQEQCTRVAAPDSLDCGPVGWPAQRFEAGEICHQEDVFIGTRPTITVVDTCATCGQQPGPCTVTIDESGFAPVLQVDVSRTNTACDVDCPAICMRMEHQCVVPDGLAPETAYQVIVNGRSFGTTITASTFGGGEETCVGFLAGG